DAFSLILISEISRAREDSGQVLKHRVLRAPIEKVGGSYLHACSLGVQFLNGHDPIRLPVRQRAKQYGINNAEYRRARANAKRECDNHERSESRMFEQAANAVADVF